MKVLLKDDTSIINKKIKPYTKEEYVSEVREALEQFERGKYTSLEDFEKNLKTGIRIAQLVQISELVPLQ
jgi:RNA polymerase-interacting CarD/CdnL/TRCF family regulator